MNSLFVFILFMLLPFFYGIKKPQNNFKSNPDLGWLKDQILFSEILSPDHWEKDTKIKFSKNGIPMYSNQSNPVTVSQYALACLGWYHKTDSAAYLEKFTCVAEYLMDTASYKKQSDNRNSYPYKSAWRDMKAGWSSGLAQAEVMGVLIRHYAITKQKSVLPYIIKAKNQMLHPVDSGGCLGKSPEGNIWIEEYPGSKQNPQVLNGFLVSTAFLYEYCNLFKDDIAAKKILDSCYHSIKASAHYYDSGTGLYYDRVSKSNVNNWYMKAQVIEALQLYKITGDKYFLHLHALWSTYTYNKPVNSLGCSFNDTNFSSPSIAQAEGWMVSMPSYSDLITPETIDTGWIAGEKKFDIVKKLFDRNQSTFHAFDLKKDSSRVFKIFVRLKEKLKCQAVSLVLPSDSLLLPQVEFSAKASGGRMQKVQLTERKVINKSTYFFFPEKEISEFNIAVTIPAEKKVFNFSDINLHHSSSVSLSQFSHYAAGSFTVTAEKFQVSLETRDLKDYYIFYKSSKTTEKELGTVKYRADKTIVPKTTVSSEGKFYSFMVVYKNEKPGSAARNFKIIE